MDCLKLAYNQTVTDKKPMEGFLKVDEKVVQVWLSVDPLSDKYPSLSPHAYCANNPIIITDPDGRTLEIGDNTQTKDDILSIVNKGHQDRVIFENGMVSVNTEGLSQEALDNDCGLSLLSKMAGSDKRYYYEASDEALCRNESGERNVRMFNSKESMGCINASNGGTDSNGGYQDRPMKGFDGQVVLSLSGKFSYGNQNRRRNMVFHELAENYFRTDLNMNYSRGNRDGAHRTAANMEFKCWNTMEAGCVDFTPSPNPRMNRERVSQYLKNGIYK